MSNQPIELTPQDETARRIAACVSAFEGIPTDRIEGKNLGEILAGEVRLNGAGPRADGGFGFEFSGGVCQLMAEAYAEQFRQSGAINYLELLFHHSDIGPLTITMQRIEGLTPAQKLAQAEAQRDALAAENAALKSGPHGFFAYGGECGYEEFKTAEEAREFADEEIASYREQACDGWSDEVRGVVWGIVMQRATMTGLRPVEEGDNCAEGFTEWCDYTLLPNVETPVTDASLNPVRAEGIIMFASKQLAAASDLESTITLERLMLDAEEFAGQLRAGKDGE